LCYRAGDNAQILALTQALGWPFEVKRPAYRPGGRIFDVWRGTNLLGIDRARSSALESPWPDLIVTAAMRNEPVCRWIRRESGGQTRYVHIGKPWADASRFDLVLTVPEYPVPDRPNVLRTRLSLNRATPATLEAAAERWAPRLAHLPRPYVAVLVGGYAGPHCFDEEKAERLGRDARALAERMGGGSLLVTTSARTAPGAADALEAAMGRPADFHRWRPDDPDNPYYGYLALADAVVVTSDSTMMLAEACATGKPVHMFDLLQDDPPPSDEPWPTRLKRWWRRCNFGRLKAFLYREIFWGGLVPRYLVRDIRVVHEELIRSRRVVWLGQPFPAEAPPLPDEMKLAVERVRALFPADRVAPAAETAAAPALTPTAPHPATAAEGHGSQPITRA
jgi:mitochondrial fission protein ELM1